MGSIMGSPKIMRSDYGSNISASTSGLKALCPYSLLPRMTDRASCPILWTFVGDLPNCIEHYLGAPSMNK